MHEDRIFSLNDSDYYGLLDVKAENTVVPMCIVKVKGQEYLSLKLTKSIYYTKGFTIFHKVNEFCRYPNDFFVRGYRYNETDDEMYFNRDIVKNELKNIKHFYNFCTKGMIKRYPEYFL